MAAGEFSDDNDIRGIKSQLQDAGQNQRTGVDEDAAQQRTVDHIHGVRFFHSKKFPLKSFKYYTLPGRNFKLETIKFISWEIPTNRMGQGDRQCTGDPAKKFGKK